MDLIYKDIGASATEVEVGELAHGAVGQHRAVDAKRAREAILLVLDELVKLKKKAGSWSARVARPATSGPPPTPGM